MKLVYDIFEKLQLNQTFFTQFILVIIIFFLVKFLLMSKLQEVLDLREGKTVKREAGANEKFSKAGELADKYSQRIAEANSNAQKKIELKKQEVNKKEQNIFKEEVAKVELEMTGKREKTFQEVEVHKAAMMNEKDVLVEQLIEKVTK